MSRFAKVRIECPKGTLFWEGEMLVGPDSKAPAVVSAFCQDHGLLLWAPLRLEYSLTETPEDIPVGLHFSGRSFSQEEVVVEVVRK